MLHIDIEPLEALRIYYQNEKLGVWLGDIRQAEKQRKVFLPPLLRDFLLGYGRFAVNADHNSCCYLNPMLMNITDDDLVIFGRIYFDKLLAFRRADFAAENPQLYCAERQYAEDNLDEEKLDDDDSSPWSDFAPAGLRLRDFLIWLIIRNLRTRSLRIKAGADLTGLEAPAELLALLQDEQDEQADKLTGEVICWDDETGELWGVSREPDGWRNLYRFVPSFYKWELQELFNLHFYQKTDFARALPVAQQLIALLQQQEKDTLELADIYKLAGRCCWAVGRWGEAEEFYRLAEPIFEKQLAEMLDKVKYFYQAKGNFYAARQDEPKSRQAYARVDKICEFAGQGAARARGMRLVNQTIEIAGINQDLVDDLGTLQCAQEMYNRALAEYQQDPKDCKYDIARTQQLRADVRRKIKSLGGPKSE